jgi:hypothetical protein
MIAQRGAESVSKRRVTAALALVYLLGLFAHALHFAQERHSVCEHGDVVHAAADRAGVDGTEPRTRTHRPRPDSPAIEEAAGAGGHHHCPLAIPAPCDGFALANGTGASALVPTRAHDVRPAEPRAGAFPLYLLAPHHSPPLG